MSTATERFMPVTLLALTCLSLLNTTISFGLAFFNYGLLAVWLSAGSALATLLYHLSVALFAYRRWYRRKATGDTRPARHYRFSGLMWAYILLALWLVIFGLVLQIAIGGMMGLQPSETNTTWNFGIQIGECILAGFEMIIMGTIAIHYTLGNKRETVEDVILAESRRKHEQTQSPIEEKSPNRRSSFLSNVGSLAPPQPALVKNSSTV